VTQSRAESQGKRRRKTVEQRFYSWWERNNCYGRHLPMTADDLRDYMRIAYYNGWAARTRTKR
jgi:hypothetical protein